MSLRLYHHLCLNICHKCYGWPWVCGPLTIRVVWITNQINQAQSVTDKAFQGFFTKFFYLAMLFHTIKYVAFYSWRSWDPKNEVLNIYLITLTLVIVRTDLDGSIICYVALQNIRDVWKNDRSSNHWIWK